jgi:RNA polymerase sigma-70 factor, ECF subfamily
MNSTGNSVAPDLPGETGASRAACLRLAEGLRKRDPAAVREVMSLHGDRLFRSAFLMCHNIEADAQDLVQDTFVQAVKSAHLYLGKSSLHSWLHGILINVHRNFRRKQSRLIYTDDVPEPDSARDPEPSGTEFEITPAGLTRALGNLSDEHREVVILYYFNGMTTAQIAQQTGTTLGTAKSRLHYAVKELRQALQKS